MAYRQWNTLKVRFCDHVNNNVKLEVEEIYPEEFLPDQPARLHAHRCSLGTACSSMDKAACCWSGSNPGYDPFQSGE
jgi:hypothetical protein